MWGSSSRLVQVTVLPAPTVSVAGANAKLSMVTWSPLAGTAGAVIDGVAPASGLSVTDGCALGREAEQPASTKLTATTATEMFSKLGDLHAKR